MRQIFATIIAAAAGVFLLQTASAQNHTQLHVVTTGDVHGSWFDQPYIEGGKTKTSLMSVKVYVDSLRQAVGRDNVLLLDAGDNLQGDNAAYYFNNIADQSKPHPYPRIAKYMGYDAVTIGNHDLETGHDVYDKVFAELTDAGIPWLGGNVIKKNDGGTYFPLYKIFDRAGVKVAVFGFENPNMEAWLPEELWSGMSFLSLVPYVQSFVDYVVKKEKPQVVIAVVHAGTGNGDGTQLENQALDLFNSLKGVDLLVGAHDHRPYVAEKQGFAYINGGARAGSVGHAVIDVHTQGRRVLAKDVHAELHRIDKNKVDYVMQSAFKDEFEQVKNFTNQEVGEIVPELRSRDAYAGPADYVSLIHTVQLSVPEAKISFAAPLSFNGVVKPGTVIFNDMFTIYPYENQLYVVNLKGSEIKGIMECSYANWIRTPGEHVLLIAPRSDARTGSEGWSFVNRSYNFDSTGGLVYTVDVTKPAGERIEIKSFADGSAFDMNAMYPVAMTSYRASGGGELLLGGAGLDNAKIESRIVAKYPAIRDMIYQFIKEHKIIDKPLIADESVIGSWKFVPEEVAGPLLEKDMELLFHKAK